MKLKQVIIVVLFSLLLTNCVQKASKKTVVFTLDVSGIKDVKKVGIRGNDKPLSWDYDTSMKEIKKDSLYQVTVTTKTGYKFSEIKFVVNDTFELQNGNNRKVFFSEKDTTYFAAKFNTK